MRFCNRCGNQLGGEKFCTKCGTRVEVEVMQGSFAATAAPRRKALFAAIGIAVVGAVVVIALCLFLFSGRSYEKTVDSYIEALVDGDIDKWLSLWPDECIDYIVVTEYDGDRNAMINDLKKSYYESSSESDEFNVDLSDIDFEITYTEDYTDDEIADFIGLLRKDGVNIEIEEAKYVYIDLKTNVDGEEETRPLNITVGKIGRSWYILPFV